MKIYPYQTPEGVIELVEKREYDRLLKLLDDNDDMDSTSESEVIQELQAQNIQLLQQNERLIGSRNKLHAANAELIERLAEARESHLHASARDVQTIQRQSVVLERMAGALKAIDDLRNDDFPFGGDFSDKATSAFVTGSDALSAYESAKLEPVANPIDEAVRRMEAVTDGQIVQAYWSDGSWISNVRASLISAAKGES